MSDPTVDLASSSTLQVCLPPLPSFAQFTFKTIGKQPQLLKRFSAPEPGSQPYRSPSSSPPSTALNEHTATDSNYLNVPLDTSANRRSGRTLLQTLAPDTVIESEEVGKFAAAADAVNATLMRLSTPSSLTPSRLPIVNHTISSPSTSAVHMSSDAQTRMDVDTSVPTSHLSPPHPGAPLSPIATGGTVLQFPQPLSSRTAVSPVPPVARLPSTGTRTHTSLHTSISTAPQTQPTHSATLVHLSTRLSSALTAHASLSTRISSLLQTAELLRVEADSVGSVLEEAGEVVNWAGEVVKEWEEIQRVKEKRKQEEALRKEEQERRVRVKQEEERRQALEIKQKAEEGTRRAREQQEKMEREHRKERERKLKEEEERCRLAKEKQEQELLAETVRKEAEQRRCEECEKAQIEKARREEIEKKNREKEQQLDGEREYQRRRKQVMEDKQRANAQDAKRILERRKAAGIAASPPSIAMPAVNGAPHAAHGSPSPFPGLSPDTPLTHPPRPTSQPQPQSQLQPHPQNSTVNSVNQRQNPNPFVPATTEAGRRVETDRPFSSITLASERASVKITPKSLSQSQSQSQSKSKEKELPHTSIPASSPYALTSPAAAAVNIDMDMSAGPANHNTAMSASNLRHLREGAVPSAAEEAKEQIKMEVKVQVKSEPSTPQVHSLPSLPVDAGTSSKTKAAVVPPPRLHLPKRSRMKTGTEEKENARGPSEDAVSLGEPCISKTSASRQEIPITPATLVPNPFRMQAVEPDGHRTVVTYPAEEERPRSVSVAPTLGPVSAQYDSHSRNLSPPRPSPHGGSSTGDGGWREFRNRSSEPRNSASNPRDEDQLESRSQDRDDAKSESRRPRWRPGGGGDHYSPQPEAPRARRLSRNRHVPFVRRPSGDHYSPPSPPPLRYSPPLASAPARSQHSSLQPSPPLAGRKRNRDEATPWESELQPPSQRRRPQDAPREWIANDQPPPAVRYDRPPSPVRTRVEAQFNQAPLATTMRSVSPPRGRTVHIGRGESYRPPAPLSPESLPLPTRRTPFENNYMPDSNYTGYNTHGTVYVEPTQRTEPRYQHEQPQWGTSDRYVAGPSVGPSASPGERDEYSTQKQGVPNSREFVSLLDRMSDSARPPPSGPSRALSSNVHNRKVSERPPNQTRGKRGTAPQQRPSLAARMSTSTPTLQDRLE